MHGALYVVADLDGYLENPEGYLAKNPLPIKDDLLKYNRPRTEWKLEELVDAVKEMEAKGSRNFANGKQMFTVSTCIACHKFGGQGNEFGPDLTKLDPKVFKSAVDVTEHILDPAKRIEDKYAMYRLVLDNDKIITAMIVEEKDGVVKVIENPLASTKPVELKAATIVERKKLATSIMPKGLLEQTNARGDSRPARLRVGQSRSEGQILRCGPRPRRARGTLMVKKARSVSGRSGFNSNRPRSCFAKRIQVLVLVV